ncbi:MAG: UDP-glucose 4-epimerase GalE [Candidatus Melainabacteria bacterium]|nr:UDP-glucose 4-epimerase GalE [Candidatus Melainabacteria bacterium]
MAILVTGGAGYIGSHCVQQLLAFGHGPVVVYDNFSTGHLDTVQRLLEIASGTASAKAPVLYVEQGDVRDEATLTAVLQQYQVSTVMHLAAACYVEESVKNPSFYYDINVIGTHCLLSAMRQAGVRNLIVSSSCAIYGAPHQLPIDESHSQNPVNPYGFTKRVVEQMLLDLTRSALNPLRYVSLRYFNAAGADPQGRIGECHEPETHLIPIILQTIAGDRPSVSVYGSDYETPDGTCIRDYVHVEDIARAHRLALDYLEAGGESDVFNIGSEVGYSVLEVIATCEKVTGLPVPVIRTPRRSGDPAALVASAKKIRRRLGWQAQFPDLESTIRTAWQWEQIRRQQSWRAASVPANAANTPVETLVVKPQAL